MRLSSSRTTKEAGRSDELSPEGVPVYPLSLVFHHEKSELVTWANLPPKARTSPSKSRGEATCRNIYTPTLMLGKTEGKRKRGRQRMRWLDGIINRHEFEQTQRDSEGQGSLVGGSPWNPKDSDMTEQVNTNTWGE